MKFNDFITFLGTKDLTATSNFYKNILGLTLYKDQGVCLIFNINSKSKIGFCEHMQIIHTKKSPILTFVTNDVDEYYNRLIGKGIVISDRPRLNEKFKIYHFFFEDPNGYTIEIQKFLDL
jgi:catechol 2,3-dioxygenase-like lactoylglutathione lyase family enzyme